MSRFGHLLTDTVTLALQTGQSAGGTPTYGAQSTVKARVEDGTEIVLDQEGQERRAKHAVCIEDVFAVEALLAARFWLPGDDTGSDNASRRAIAVDSAADPGKTQRLTELFF